ncbi:PrpR N-terminal domain-containing protein [Clostridium sp. AN503]|uniref:sigma-54-dependent transcriptional regulator n=1 Tax=Clostridium sp. AN503 TaxID=3160598 RepID=UPI003459E38D
MVKTGTRILGIAPYEGMRTVMERAAQAYPDVQLDVYIGDLLEGAAVVQRMPPNSYDCIISRGGTAMLIRQVTDLPVVDIHLSVYDVLSAMKLAENYSDLYAIVGFPSITEPAHTLCDLLGYHLDILTVHSADEVPQILERLEQDGYRMVVCDMVTHTAARQMGLDAFLITSGVESLHTAIDQAVNISQWFQRLRQENLFLRSITQDQNGRVVVLEHDGAVFYSSPTKPAEGLLKALRERLREVPSAGSLKFYHTERDQLYRITAQTLLMDDERYSLFYCVPSRISLHSQWGRGLRSMNRGECEYLFMTSFYSISGAMGTLDSEIRTLAAVRQPVMIRGEAGTGKEQIARYLYLHSPLANKPFVLVNCELMTEKSWDFLLGHDNSPLNATGNTVYFQNFESLPETRGPELLAAILETGLARRVRLLFSFVCRDGEPVPDMMRRFSTRLGCLTLNLPSLRSRSDEIPSLASLYLSNLKIELGKQISGFEPRAIEMLRQYDWPNNYTQFKHVLRTLATLTASTYIRSNAVAELLAKERSLRLSPVPAAASLDIECTLEEIIGGVVQQAVAAHNGNRAAAARQLGISRTTLWRYLNKSEEDFV